MGTFFLIEFVLCFLVIAYLCGVAETGKDGPGTWRPLPVLKALVAVWRA